MLVATKSRLQRKRLFQAPLHQRYKYFAATLSPELKKSHSVNSLPVRVGDTVRIMRGDRKGIEGKVSSVDRKKYRIFIEGITREKVDGTAVPVPIHPSKVMIINLNLDDKWRRKILDRKHKKLKTETPEKPELEEKPRKKPKTLKKGVKKEKQKKGTKRKTVEKTKAEKSEAKEG